MTNEHIIGLTPPDPEWIPPPTNVYEEQPIKEEPVELPSAPYFEKATLEFMPTDIGDLSINWDRDLSMIEAGRHTLARKLGDRVDMVDVTLTRKLDTIEVSYALNGMLYHHIIKANGRMYTTETDQASGRGSSQKKSMWRRY